MPRLRRRITGFLREEEASVAIEGLLMLPVLIWCYLGVFVFFDAYRSQSTNIKAAYTIGDMISRETNYITPEYMDALHNLQLFLTDTDQNVDLRVSVIFYDGIEDEYLVRWSETRGGPAPLTDATLAAIRPQLPIMADTDVAILTETWVDYDPVYEVGIGNFTFEDLVVTRPRFAPQVCWNPLDDGGADTAVC